MKLDKEYPATHSMSTAWYVADEEGNVGIMHFNENGPVPWQTEETSMGDLVFGHQEGNRPNQYLMIDLTDEQIDDLLVSPHSPEEEDDWHNCVIQIDVTKEKRFLELAKGEKFDLQFCISRLRGLYSVDAIECTFLYYKDGRYPVLKRSPLGKMLDQGIILQVYHKKELRCFDNKKNGRIVHTKYFSSAPYYIFNQSYWYETLPECINVPEFPVKLDQFPEKLKKRVLCLPVKFKETKNFQIAEWYPCAIYPWYDSPTETVDGCAYERLPLTDGKQAYVLFDMFRSGIFFKACADCESDCVRHEDHCFTSTPTVLAIMHPLEKWNYNRQINRDFVIQQSVWIPFIHKFPWTLKKASPCWPEEKCQAYLSDKNIKRRDKMFEMTVFFQHHHQWLEIQIKRFNPRVIIVSAKAKQTLETVYSMENGQIEINGVSYPVYLLSELRKYRAEIERLASLPYQGKHIPHIITVEEMEKR